MDVLDDRVVAPVTPVSMEEKPVFEEQELILAKLNSLPVVEHDTTIEQHANRTNTKFRNLGRTACKLALICGLATPIFAIGGNVVTPAKTQIGPNNAEVSLTLDYTQNIDLGVPGSFIKRTDLPGPFGLHVDIKEIPGAETATGKSDFTSEDLQTYANLLSDPAKDRNNIIMDMAKHGGEWALGGDALLIGLYFWTGAERRKQLTKKLLPSGRIGRLGLSAALAVSLAGGAAGAGSIASASYNYPPVNRVFDGTPLEGYSVKGKILQVAINRWGTEFFGYLKQNSDFYATVQKNLKKAFGESVVLSEDESTILAVFEGGINCNQDMIQILEDADKLFKPSILLGAGDSTMGLAELDGSCISSLAYHTRGLKKVEADGDHDLDSSIAQEKDQGFTVLKGEVVDTKGLKIIGDISPRLAEFGNGQLVPRRNETEAAMGARIGSKACASKEPVDIALFNEPSAARAAAEYGCVKLALSNGYQQKLDMVGAVPNYVGASAAGKIPGNLNLSVGPIKDSRYPGELTFIQFDKTTGNPLFYQVVSVLSDASVEITPISVF